MILLWGLASAGNCSRRWRTGSASSAPPSPCSTSEPCATPRCASGFCSRIDGELTVDEKCLDLTINHFGYLLKYDSRPLGLVAAACPYSGCGAPRQ